MGRLAIYVFIGIVIAVACISVFRTLVIPALKSEAERVQDKYERWTRFRSRWYDAVIDGNIADSFDVKSLEGERLSALVDAMNARYRAEDIATRRMDAFEEDYDKLRQLVSVTLTPSNQEREWKVLEHKR